MKIKLFALFLVILMVPSIAFALTTGEIPLIPQTVDSQEEDLNAAVDQEVSVLEEVYQPAEEQQPETAIEIAPVVEISDLNGDGVIDVLDWIEASKQTQSNTVLDDFAEEIVE